MSNLYIDLLKAFREIGQLQNNQKVVERTEYLLKQAKQKNTKRKRVTQEDLEE